MTVKINYSGKISNLSTTSTILFCDEKFNIKTLKKNLNSTEFNYIEDLLKDRDLKKKLFIFNINSKKRIVLISIKNDILTSEIESLGAEFFSQVKQENK